MKSLIIHIILLLSICIYVSKPIIRLKPFSIEFDSLFTGIGLLLICIGISLSLYDIRKEARIDGAYRLVKSMQKK